LLAVCLPAVCLPAVCLPAVCLFAARLLAARPRGPRRGRARDRCRAGRRACAGQHRPRRVEHRADSDDGSPGYLMFHSFIVPAAQAVTRVRPFGLNASLYTDALWPVRVAIGAGWAGSVTFHSLAVMSQLAVARVCPFGLNATPSTTPRWSVR